MLVVMRRTVRYNGIELEYQLEQKNVKNINLRIRRDGSVYASANDRVPPERVDAFVESKGSFILAAKEKFEKVAQRMEKPRQYVSGEVLQLLGRRMPLCVVEAEKDKIFSDGNSIFLMVKNAQDIEKKKRMVVKYLDGQCREIFGQILEEQYPAFEGYCIPKPALRIRKMKARWGSCLVYKGVITLNKSLLEVPRNCIAYVVVHELCHFLYPNHSKQFYNFLAMQMPDWRERKKILDTWKLEQT